MKKKKSCIAAALCAAAFTFFFSGCGPGAGETFTVTFESNGGGNVAAVTGVASGATITLPAAPEKSGSAFSGWYTDNTTFQNEFTSSTPVTADITVYAKWTETSTEKKLVIKGIDLSGGISVVLADRVGIDPMPDMPAGGKAADLVPGSDVTITLMDTQHPASNWEPGEGSLLYFIHLWNTLTPEPEQEPDYTAGVDEHTGISFSNAITEVEWSKFIEN